MGLFDTLNKKASAETLKQFEALLLPGEGIQEFNQTFHSPDSFVVTDRRLILKDFDFDWGDSKAATFSVALGKITSLSMTSDAVGLVKKHKVGVHVGGLTIKLTFFKKEDCTAAYMLLTGLIYG